MRPFPACVKQGMVVLFTWQYFERLWCVYEWAAFLIYHDPEDVSILVDVFHRSSSQQLYIDSVENFSALTSKCYNEDDRKLLNEKIDEYYISNESFARFAQVREG